MTLKAFIAGAIYCGASALTLANAQISAVENQPTGTMETALEGSGIDVTGLTVQRGNTRQYGTFSNGLGTIGIEAGVFISTGRGINFGDPATSMSDMANLGNTPDLDLTAGRATATNDTASLVMTVTPMGDTIAARIVFASEEYPEYVCSAYNDAFGLYVTEPGVPTQNIAVIPGTTQDVSINTINNGFNNNGQSCPGEGPNNSNLYNNNPNGPNFIFNGYTDALNVQLDGVTPGQNYTFKMVVADAIDTAYDSAVFVDFLESTWANTADASFQLTPSTVSPIVGQNFTITATLSNAGPDPIPFLKVKDLLPDGLTFVSASGDGTYDETLDEWETTAPLAAEADFTVTLTVSAPSVATFATDAEVIEQWSDDVDSTPNDGTGDDFASLSVSSQPMQIFCPSGSTANGRATSGTGAFRDEIYWLDWSCGGVTQFNPGARVTKSWDAGNGLALTAQISNITAAIRPYNTGDWSGDVLDELYSGINPIGLANAVASEDPQFDITFSATLNGVPIAADIVIADAEDAGASNEAAVFTTDGTAFQPIEATGVLGATFSNAGRTLRLDDVPNAGGGTLLALSEGVSTINIDMQAGGVSAAAFGVFVPFDHGDASGYGTSQAHYSAVTASGGSQPASATAVTSLTLANVSYGGSLYLGSTAPDIEGGNQPSANATGDDSVGTDDEDGVTFPTLRQGQSATISVDVTQVSANSGYLQGWIDWDGDGSFGAGEQVAADLQSADAGASTIEVSTIVPLTATTDQTFARFRWSTTSGLDATAAAPDGEVEDYAVSVQARQLPPVTPQAFSVCTAETVLYEALFDDGGDGNWVSTQAQNPPIGYFAPSNNIANAYGTQTDVTAVSTLNGGLGVASPSGGGFVGSYDNAGGIPFWSSENLSGADMSSVLGGAIYFERFNYASNNPTYTDQPQDFYIVGSTGRLVLDIATPGPVLSTGAWVPIERKVAPGPEWFFIPNTDLTSQTGRVQATAADFAAVLSSVNSVGVAAEYISVRDLDGRVGLITPVDETNVDRVERYALDTVKVASCQSDSSDAPLTGTSYGGARHAISTGIQLGASVTADIGDYDDPSAAGDADDGVTFPTLTQGQAATISVAVNQASGNSGYLQGWIDWNGDGDFDDPAEQVARDLQFGGGTNGTISVPLTVPAIATTNPTFARFRWSTTSGLDATTVAGDGEVEDYQVTIDVADGGSTVLPPVCSTGARATLDWTASSWPQSSLSNTYAVSDTDISVQVLDPQGALNGTPNGPTPVNAAFYEGGLASIDNTLIFEADDADLANGDVTIRYDFSRSVEEVRVNLFDLDFSDLGPRIERATITAYNGATPVPVTLQGGSAILVSGNSAFGIAESDPIGAGSGDGTLRIGVSAPIDRLEISYGHGAGTDRDSNPGNPGFGLHDLSFCAQIDRSDAPAGYGAADHAFVSGFLLGSRNDSDAASLASADASGDGADDDGVTLPVLTQGLAADIQVDVTGPGLLQGWIDFDGDGAFGAGEQIAADVQDGGTGDSDSASNGMITLSVTAPVNGFDGTSIARFRWSSNTGLGPTGLAGDGEVEDYQVEIAEIAALAFTPDNTRTVSPGSSVIYAHNLLIPETLAGGTLDFTQVSDQDLIWTIWQDVDGSGDLSSADTVWVNGNPVPGTGSIGFLLKSEVPNDAHEGWRDLSTVTATVTLGGQTRSDSVTDITDVNALDAGSLRAYKFMALDLNCDGDLSDESAADAAFEVRKQAQPGQCVIYRIGFVNDGIADVSAVNVRDHVPAWTVYEAGSATYETTPTGLTAGTLSAPAGGTRGPISFPYTGSLPAGEEGTVTYGVRVGE